MRRYTSGATPTTYRFTGQREQNELGLYFYQSRWYDPYLNRFAQADTIIPNPYDSQSWDRFAYARNAPTRYVDPTGHGACSGPFYVPECGEIDINDDGIVGSPWQEDSGYDPDTNSIPEWGDPNNTDNDWDMDRAELVWGWICRAGGWWGSGCPSPYDLTVWLFWQEGGDLMSLDVWYVNYDPTLPLSEQVYNQQALKAAKQMITYIRDRLADGIDPRADLGKFTPFFNPNSGGSFNSGDWSELMTQPIDASIITVNDYWYSANPNPGAIIVWWRPGEANAPGYNYFLYDVTNPQSDNEVILRFGMW